MTEPDEVLEVTVEEYGVVDVDPALLLTPEGRLVINSDVRNKDAYRVSFRDGLMRFTASSLVGVIPLNDRVVLRVKPRVPIANLTQMVLDTNHPTVAIQAIREYRGHGTAQDWMLDQYAQAYLTLIENVLNQGMYRRYEQRFDAGGFPRGRIEIHETLNRFAARRVPNKAVFSWHERTPDIPANQCLRAALLAVHAHLTRPKPKGKHAKGYGDMLARLVGYLNAFRDVSDDPSMQFLKDPEVAGVRPLPEPRTYYRRALDLARLILQGRGVALELGGSDAQAGSLLIEMNDLFENYTRLMLQREASRRGWTVAVLDQEGKKPLYTEPPTPVTFHGKHVAALGPSTTATAEPDMVFQMPDGKVVLIAEVKNTAKGGLLPERDEVNQAVAYAVRYGLDTALLVRPWVRVGEPGMAYGGCVGAVHVWDYKYDLSDPDLAGVARAFADSLSALLPREATAGVSVEQSA